MPATNHSMYTADDGGTTTAFIATDPTNGDSFKVAQNGRASHFVFSNTTGSSVTVNLKAASTAAARVPGLGRMAKADVAKAVAAGACATFEILAADLPGYIDTSGNVNSTYTSGNAGLLVLPLAVGG